MEILIGIIIYYYSLSYTFDLIDNKKRSNQIVSSHIILMDRNNVERVKNLNNIIDKYKNENTYLMTYIPEGSKEFYFERHNAIISGYFGVWEFLKLDGDDVKLKIIYYNNKSNSEIFILCRNKNETICKKISEKIQYNLDLNGIKYIHTKSYFSSDQFWN